MAKVRQTNTTRFLEAPFVRMLCMRSASLKSQGLPLSAYLKNYFYRKYIRQFTNLTPFYYEYQS